MSLTKEESIQYRSDKALLVKKKVKEFEQFIGDWRKEAIECYDMVAGKQWSDEDKQKLIAEERVPVVFNRIAAFVRGVCGMETSNRQSVKYLPREMADVQGNEVMNAAAQWVRDECQAEDEESEAFRDMVITGIGCTETRLDYEEDPDGKIFIERRDPLRVGWDTTACKRNLQDASWVYAYADYSRAQFEEKWPEKSKEVFSALFPDAEGGKQSDYREAFYEGGDSQPNNDNIRVIQFQYYKTVQMYRIMDASGQEQIIQKDRFAKMKQLFDQQGVKYAKLNKREYRQCFVAGDIELEDVPLPYDGFTLHFLTGIRDRNKGMWYGMVRDAIDPQKWSNKFFSLAIDILATNPKGGLMAEADAFEDRQKAEENWANPREIVWTRPGAIRDGKIQPRQPVAAPPQLDNMMGFAVSSLPQIMGINMEFLGLADRAQAGVLESQRKQAAITTLAEFFAALSLYRKVQGKCLMKMALTYIADGRLMRIVGNENAQYIPFVRQPGFEKFDVIVDEAPNAPDVKARTWEVLQNLLPQLLKMGVPIPPEALDYSPIPSSLAAKWKQMLGQKPQVDPAMQQQMQQMMEEMQGLQQENQKLKTDQTAKFAQLQADSQLKMQQLQADREKMSAELLLQKEKSAAELELKRQIAEIDAEIAMAKAAADMQMKIQGMVADVHLKKAKQETEKLSEDETSEPKNEGNEAKKDSDALAAAIQGMTAAITTLNKPKKVVRGKNNEIMGVE